MDNWQTTADKVYYCIDHDDDPSCVGVDANEFNEAAHKAAGGAKATTLDSVPFIFNTTGVSAGSPSSDCSLLLCEVAELLDFSILEEKIFEYLRDITSIYEKSEIKTEPASLRVSAMSSTPEEFILRSIDVTVDHALISGNDLKIVNVSYTADVIEEIMNSFSEGHEFAFKLDALDPTFGSGLGVGRIASVLDGLGYGTVGLEMTFFTGEGLVLFNAVPEPSTVALIWLALGIYLVAVQKRKLMSRD